VVLPKGTAHLKNAQIIKENLSEEAPSRGPMVEMSVFEQEDDVLHTTYENKADVELHANGRPVLLVVDDNADIRTYIAGCLTDEYLLIKARDGRDGLEKVHKFKPDLVISDVMMPNMNGYQLCTAMKSDPTVNHIPVILLTSKASLEDKITGLEAGSDDYIAKPFSAKELRARVHNLLRLSEQQKTLKHLNEELTDTNEALIEASETKTTLLNMASHDMKNPLTAIREFSNILKEELGDDLPQSELLDLIYTASDQMLHQITQLLDSAALESGKLMMDNVPVNVIAVAEEVVRRNKKQAERKEQRLILTHSGQDDLVIEADTQRLIDAMDNLISNAIKYSPLGKDIHVTVSRAEQGIRFVVQDEGPGLTETDMERIFGKFQKLSARPTGGESSTGLGLSLVKQIVERHNGKVWVDSHQGTGSTFTMEFPLPSIAIPATAPSRGPIRPEHTAPNTQRTTS